MVEVPLTDKTEDFDQWLNNKAEQRPKIWDVWPEEMCCEIVKALKFNDQSTRKVPMRHLLARFEAVHGVSTHTKALTLYAQEVLGRRSWSNPGDST